MDNYKCLENLLYLTFISSLAWDWGDENVTNRVAECDPVFVPLIFFILESVIYKMQGTKTGSTFKNIGNIFITPAWD
ncbi:MAG: hypothetical protein KAI83_08100 [Thiomargarita sp.]|nr:hypothetical protein [Thiomargarita sp.]